MYTHSKQIITTDLPIGQAKKAVIMLHGRGSTAQDIIGLANYLDLKDAAIFAQQATQHSWYPYSFMAPVKNNQPALDSALQLIDDLVGDLRHQGMQSDQLYLMGFSQGACLTLEYVSRNAIKYGGIIAFTGGLIGEQLNSANYAGDFEHTPVLITTGDPDPHVPVSRVEDSVAIMQNLNAQVTLKIYKGRPHTVSAPELALANQLIFKNDA